jgi:hypothetical protein
VSRRGCYSTYWVDLISCRQYMYTYRGAGGSLWKRGTRTFLLAFLFCRLSRGESDFWSYNILQVVVVVVRSINCTQTFSGRWHGVAKIMDARVGHNQLIDRLDGASWTNCTSYLDVLGGFWGAFGVVMSPCNWEAFGASMRLF